MVRMARASVDSTLWRGKWNLGTSFLGGMQSRRQKRNFCSPPRLQQLPVQKSSPVGKNREGQGLGCGEHLGKRDGTPTLQLSISPQCSAVSAHCPTTLEWHEKQSECVGK
jgi:hypothetical protein